MHFAKQRFVLEEDALLDSSQEARQLDALRKDAGLLWKYLQQGDVTDVVVNADGKAWAKRTGFGFEEVGSFAPHETRRLLVEVASIKEVEFNQRQPILQTDFPLDGSRIEGVCSPVARGSILALRTRAREIYTLEDFVRGGIVTHRRDPLNQRRRRSKLLETLSGDLDHEAIIRLAVQNYFNIVVAGATGTGKTTGLNMLLDLVARCCPQDRVLTIEDTMELQCNVPNTVALFEARDISMWDCVKAAMRLIPTRIVVGEVRDAAAHVMLTAWNTGHPGGFASVHANNALEALDRLERCLSIPSKETSQNISVSRSAARSEIGRVVNLVLFLEAEDKDVVPAGRKLREVLLVKGYDPDTDKYDYEYV